MYIFNEMIDLGLKEGQEFTSEDHKIVAQTIGLRNPNVTNRDILVDIVQAVLKVPQDRIRKITYEELVKEFGCPLVA